jgi:hypothetical protein
MDEDLKHYLTANFARMDERFTEVEDRLNVRIDETNARIEKVETSLLAAIHDGVRPTEIRFK